jgi:hypothetical protein
VGENQRRAVKTFQTLCEFGEFDAEARDDDANHEQSDEPRGSKAKQAKLKSGDANRNGVALTVNLQLQLPASENGEVYEKLFAAMGKHLKGLIGTE